jgi:hypothetical protein
MKTSFLIIVPFEGENLRLLELYQASRGATGYGGGDLRSGAFFPCGHQLNLLQLHSLQSEKCSHLGNLIWADEIFRVRAEFLYDGGESVAAHPLRDFKIEPAFTIRPVM